MPLACILISDITGSTQLYERKSNAEALRQITKVLDRMREIIDAAGGHCVKSKGDDTLSFFSGPDGALDAAWNMVNEDWADGLSVHAGIYFGEILSLDNDVYGNAVNTAARLATMAKPGEILIGDSCYDDLSPENRARFVKIGDMQLKGKASVTRVYSCSVVTLSELTVVTAIPRGAAEPETATFQIRHQGRIWTIAEGQTMTIGRAPECDIVLDLAWVSRKHGALSLARAQLEYTDHSSAGSLVRAQDGQELAVHRRATLLHGDGMIYFGGRDAHGPDDALRYSAATAGITA